MSDTPNLDGITVYDPHKRCAKQKYEVPTRLDEKTEKDKKDDKAWEACKKVVDKREKNRCQCCGRKVVKTLELQANRAEHHHIIRRKKEPALLTDERNVVLLCYECHRKVTGRKLHIVGTAAYMFELNSQHFIDARKPLRFVDSV